MSKLYDSPLITSNLMVRWKELRWLVNFTSSSSPCRQRKKTSPMNLLSRCGRRPSCLSQESSITHSRTPTKRQANVGELRLPIATPRSCRNSSESKTNTDKFHELDQEPSGHRLILSLLHTLCKRFQSILYWNIGIHAYDVQSDWDGARWLRPFCILLLDQL